jgi:hypothetical protein
MLLVRSLPIAHDGRRNLSGFMRSADGERVRRYSGPGNDLTKRFPLIVEAST